MPGGPHRDFGVLISDVIDLHRSAIHARNGHDRHVPYLVGIQTVANACVFALYAILKRPELKTWIVAEADRFFAEPPSAENLQRLDVTRRAVLDSMRMYPAASAVFRKAANSFDFVGYRVPAGRSLFVATTVT